MLPMTSFPLRNPSLLTSFIGRDSSLAGSLFNSTYYNLNVADLSLSDIGEQSGGASAASSVKNVTTTAQVSTPFISPMGSEYGAGSDTEEGKK